MFKKSSDSAGRGLAGLWKDRSSFQAGAGPQRRTRRALALPLWMPSRGLTPASRVVAHCSVASAGRGAVILSEGAGSDVPDTLCCAGLLASCSRGREEPACGAERCFPLSPALGSLCGTAAYRLPLCGKPGRRKDGWFSSLWRTDSADHPFPLAGSTRRRRLWRSLTRRTWGWRVGVSPVSPAGAGRAFETSPWVLKRCPCGVCFVTFRGTRGFVQVHGLLPGPSVFGSSLVRVEGAREKRGAARGAAHTPQVPCPPRLDACKFQVFFFHSSWLRAAWPGLRAAGERRGWWKRQGACAEPQWPLSS